MSGRDSDSPSPVLEARGRVLLRVRVTPRARKPGVLGSRGGAIACAVGAAPEHGKATDEALELIAEWLGLRTAQVRLLRGATSRDKVLALSAISAPDLRKRIETALASPHL